MFGDIKTSTIISHPLRTNKNEGETDLNSMVEVKCSVDEKYKLLEESKTENK